MATPLLTIVTVTLNCARTIRATLDSVQAIKTQDIEYLVIDGASNDATLDVIAKYDGLINELVSEPDTGVYNAMNKGIKRATGRYILFINGDDALVPEGFPAVLVHLKKHQDDIISATTLVGSTDAPDEVLLARPLHLPFYSAMPHPSTFVKTELMRAWLFDERYKIAADYDFFLRAFVARKSFVQLPTATAIHARGGLSDNLELVRAEFDRIRRARLGPFLFVLSNVVGWCWPLARPVYRLLKGRGLG